MRGKIQRWHEMESAVSCVTAAKKCWSASTCAAATPPLPSISQFSHLCIADRRLCLYVMGRRNGTWSSGCRAS